MNTGLESLERSALKLPRPKMDSGHRHCCTCLCPMAFWVAPRAQRPSTRHGRGAQLLCLPLSTANSGGFTLVIYPESHNFSPPPAYHPGPSRGQLKSSFHGPCGHKSSPFQESHSGQCSPVTSLTFWMILEQEASHFHFALGPANYAAVLSTQQAWENHEARHPGSFVH